MPKELTEIEIYCNRQLIHEAGRNPIRPFAELIDQQQRQSVRPIYDMTVLNNTRMMARLIDRAIVTSLQYGTKARQKRGRLEYRVSQQFLELIARTDEIVDVFPLITIENRDKYSAEITLTRSNWLFDREKALEKQIAQAERQFNHRGSSVFVLDLLRGIISYGKVAGQVVPADETERTETVMDQLVREYHEASSDNETALERA